VLAIEPVTFARIGWVSEFSQLLAHNGVVPVFICSDDSAARLFRDLQLTRPTPIVRIDVGNLQRTEAAAFLEERVAKFAIDPGPAVSPIRAALVEELLPPGAAVAIRHFVNACMSGVRNRSDELRRIFAADGAAAPTDLETYFPDEDLQVRLEDIEEGYREFLTQSGRAITRRRKGGRG
jgi:hypothetical protein